MKHTKYIVADNVFMDFTIIDLIHEAYDTEQEALEADDKMVSKREIKWFKHKPCLVKIEVVRELTQEEIDAYI